MKLQTSLKNMILRAQMVECLVCGLRLAYHSRILFGEKGHPDSHFFVIVLDHSPQKGDEFFGFMGILLVEDVPTKLTHQIAVVHECPSP
jgi:hypothetical protein